MNLTENEKKLLFLNEKVEMVINETSKPNSYEFGKAGNRVKIYYETPDGLLEHINKLKELGIIEREVEVKD